MLSSEPFPSPLRVSAVVPTWNEEAEIEACLGSLRGAGVDEIIVVDGGSHDQTRERAGVKADRVMVVDGGLFQQLNGGASVATGDVIVFHYADSRFPAGGIAAIAKALSSPEVVGGAFRLSFTSRRWLFRIIAGTGNLRNRCGFGPFGDQSLFVRADQFRRLRGFRLDSFLEDYQFVRRLKRQGEFRLLDEQVETSARRWEKRGVLATLCAHWWYSLLFLAGKRHTSNDRADAEARLRTVR